MGNNAGQLCQVKEGVHSGQYAFLPNNKQDERFIKIGKAYAEFYHDSFMKQPVSSGDVENQHRTGLINIDRLTLIGFVD